MILSIVIPCYNCEKTIENVVMKIDKEMISLNNIVSSYEIILVNDFSLDKTHDVCNDMCFSKKHIKYIRFSKNFGQHNALLAGFNLVTGDYVICMDDDLQTPPEEMIKLINTLFDGAYDVVYAQYYDKKHSVFRNLGSSVNELMAYWFINKPRALKLSSYFIAKRFIIDEVIKYENPYPYLAGLILRTTSSLGNVLVNHEERTIGLSNYTFKKLFKLWLNGFTNFSVKPLRLASLLGLLFSCVSFLCVVVLLVMKQFNPNMQLGWTSIMVTISFFGGIQLLSMGLLGEYIGRIYLSINKSPAYVIRDRVNIDN